MDSKFILYKSLSNVFTLIIKQQGSTLPMTLVDSDTFTVKLRNVVTNAEAPNVTIAVTKELPLTNGKITLTFSGTGMADLVSSRGSKVDRYYLLPTYKLVIECNTTNNGNFIARIDDVYVDA